ncbi:MULTISPECIES: cyclase family protein [Rhodococcus]|uniref:Cyclase family protein n=1 Tax=Rhodococcus globerulus TaxID=33008 RepID=A0ABU4C676_RHOGO|nr:MULTISPECIES: cyclase family protein [Rhodococcus]MCE4268749.1 cyclase family protein [Rhodococcus globerulus]MDV6271703.1 cyclase family protein [Rhodococcus globerulus]MDV8069518.1 cyclase family protein [Rhodococcus sp. IEGM 1366]QXW05188.1 cyclase family protein [Rhodococcus globerulus]
MTVDDLETDPLAPWLRKIKDEHDSSRHVDGVQCRGSVDLIDESARLRGVSAVRYGKAISLEREVETRPGRLADGRAVAELEAAQWEKLGLAEMPSGHGSVELDVQVGVRGMRSAHGGDVIKYDAHGVHNTHMDGLAHIGAEGSWHGPIPAEASLTDEDTMVAWANHGIATRGVVLDVAGARGVEWIDAEHPVTGEDLDAALAATGVTLEPGDALIIYQGRDRYEAAGNIYPSGAAAVARPGIGEDGAVWIASKDPGLVLWDFHDARNNPAGSLEVHNLIYAIGLCLVDNCLLGPAVAALKQTNTSTGLVVAAPTAIHRSTGVLINPLFLY